MKQPLRHGLLSLSSVLLAASLWAQTPTEVFTATPENPANFWLNVLNPSDRDILWTFPATIECRLVSARSNLPASLTLRQPTDTNSVTIGAGAFTRREYALAAPAEFSGDIVVEFPHRTAARLLLHLPANKDEPSPLLEFLGQKSDLDSPSHPYDPVEFFKEHISGNEPMYILAGPDAPAAKFQLSFKYQLLNSHGWLAQHAPLLKGFHFGYTQTSLWDFKKASSPFYDTSYKPELLYLWERAVGGKPHDWFRLDLQTGLQHESNGKDGDESRGLNIAYVRPTFTFGHDDGFQFALSPRAWLYVISTDNNNADIDDYRGYGDLRATIGWRRGLQLSALGRMGAHGRHEAVQIDLTYPLMRILSNSFTIYLNAQYFTGYGESLLGYDTHSSIARVGLALYR